MKVYDNIIGQPTLRSAEENGIYLERGQTGGAYIYNNLFKNLNNALQFTQGTNDVFEDIFVYNNIITGVGILGQASTGNAIDWMKISGSTGIRYDNINFINNTIHAGTSGKPLTGLRFSFQGPVSNLNVKNNIVTGFAYSLYVGSSTINNMTVENNNFYGNNANNPTYTGSSINNKTESNNKSVNPLFVSSSDFHLQSSSPLIAAGISNGLILDFEGKNWNNPPSIGAYEAGMKQTSSLVAEIPVLQLCVVENISPTLIEMNFNMTLKDQSPLASAFNISVNSLKREVNNITISGTKVLLTLASPILNGNIVTLSYIKPATNALQSASGGQAASLTIEPVTNRVGSAALISFNAVIENAAPNKLQMDFTALLASTVPAASDFVVMVKNTKKTVTLVSVKDRKVTLTLESLVAKGDVVTVSYTKPEKNALITGTGEFVPSIVAKPVTNLVISKSPFVQEKIAVYPNPAQEFINVFVPVLPESKPKVLRIFDLAGKLHMENNIDAEETKTKIPLNLTSGMYVIQLTQGNSTIFSQKLMVKK